MFKYYIMTRRREEDSDLSLIRVNSNPLSNLLEVEIPQNRSVFSFQIMDFMGKLVLQQFLNESKSLISVKNLEPGTYYVRIHNEQGLFFGTAIEINQERQVG